MDDMNAFKTLEPAIDSAIRMVGSGKIRIGRSLLLGLEVLVAADIVKTIAHELTFMSLGLLAGLVLVRTFLSWPWCWKSKDAGHGSESLRPYRLVRGLELRDHSRGSRRLCRNLTAKRHAMEGWRCEPFFCVHPRAM
jgi:uncharacterized protein DUF1622